MNNCEICTHKQRDAINESIVEGRPRALIAEWFHVSTADVRLHAHRHLPAILEEGEFPHTCPTLEGMSLKQLQQRLRLVNEIQDLENGIPFSTDRRASAKTAEGISLSKAASILENAEIVGRCIALPLSDFSDAGLEAYLKFLELPPSLKPIFEDTLLAFEKQLREELAASVREEISSRAQGFEPRRRPLFLVGTA